MAFELTINGKAVPVDAPDDMPLESDASSTRKRSSTKSNSAPTSMTSSSTFGDPIKEGNKA